MSSIRLLPALAVCVALLAGCGFHPLYRPGPGVQVPQALGTVTIAPIADRIGQQLRNELLSRINPGGSPSKPEFRLTVELHKEKQDILVEKDKFTSRINLRVRAKFSLVGLADQKTVLQGQARTVTAYNVTGAQYANFVAENDAERRAVLVIADQISDRLAAHFSHAGGGKG